MGGAQRALVARRVQRVREEDEAVAARTVGDGVRRHAPAVRAAAEIRTTRA